MVVRQSREILLAEEERGAEQQHGGLGIGGGLGSKMKWVRGASRQGYRCHVNCLDGNMVTHVVARHMLGEYLLDQVVNELGIVERECVGLQFTNDKGISSFHQI